MVEMLELHRVVCSSDFSWFDVCCLDFMPSDRRVNQDKAKESGHNLLHRLPLDDVCT